jgi:hypothetical protein
MQLGICESIAAGPQHPSVSENGIAALETSKALGTGEMPPTRGSARLFDFQGRRLSEIGFIGIVARHAGNMFSVTAHGRSIIWKQYDRTESNLMLIDNFG